MSVFFLCIHIITCIVIIKITRVLLDIIHLNKLIYSLFLEYVVNTHDSWFLTKGASLRATSHTSKGPWPCNYKGPLILIQRPYYWHSLLEFATYPPRIPTNDEILSIVRHIRIHFDFLWTLYRASPSSVEWTYPGLDRFDQWEILERNGHRAFSLVCEVALISKP